VTLHTNLLHGGLVLDRRRDVARRYVKTWLFPDLCLLLLDIVAPLSEIPAPHSKFAEVARIVRLVVLFRLVRVRGRPDIGELLGTKGQQLLRVGAVLRTLAAIGILAHILTCSWYVLGRETSSENWLNQLTPAELGNTIEEYTKSMYWVLGHLTASNIDGQLNPANINERVFTLMIISLSLLIISSGVSTMANAVQEMNRSAAEVKNMEHHLLMFLGRAGVDGASKRRISRFVLHAARRRQALSLTPGINSLLSKRLRLDITESQHSQALLRHPLFQLIVDTQDHVFREVCACLQPELFADGEFIFETGHWVKAMFMTVNGSFDISSRNNPHSAKHQRARTVATRYGLHERFEEAGRIFCEISLFAKVLHHRSLMAVTFAEGFWLQGEDFARCVGQAPVCTFVVYEYATRFLRYLQDQIDEADSTDIVDDMLDDKIAKKVVAGIQRSNQVANFELHTPPTSTEAPETLMQLLNRPETTEADLVQKLPNFITELDAAEGIYAQTNFLDERERAVSSILSLFWLEHGKYEHFVATQKNARRMSRELWNKYVEFMRWVDLDATMMRTLVVLLAIRGIGKVKEFATLLPLDQRSPEDVLLSLIHKAPRLLPSLAALSPEQQRFLIEALALGAQFNLAQMLQGESTPAEVLRLQQQVRSLEYKETFKFYLVTVVTSMCSLEATLHLRGASFLNETNGRHLLLAIKCLRAMHKTPQQIYWGYIISRMKELRLPATTQENLAVGRLACLTRTHVHSLEELHVIWRSLCPEERMAICDFLLADGINEGAFMLMFLPLFFVKAKSNPAVGLNRGLLLLYDLIMALDVNGFRAAGSCVRVNLADVVSFVSSVTRPRMLVGLTERMQFSVVGLEVHISIPEHEETGHIHELGATLRRLDRKVNLVGSELQGLNQRQGLNQSESHQSHSHIPL